MKLLEKCISTLSEAEKKALANFLGRKNSSASRQDVNYLKQMGQKTSSKTNKEAALRKRIKQELAAFMALKNTELNVSGALHADLQLAIYLLDNRINKEGWWLLKKTEQKAQAEKEYSILIQVYMTMMTYAQTEFSYPIQEIISKKKEADQQKHKDEVILIELALLKEKLHQNKVQGKVELLNIEESPEIKKMLADHAIYQSPQHALSLLEMIRSQYLSERNIDQMGDVPMQIYSKIDQKAWHEKKNFKSYARFQYIIAHSYYRQGDFVKLNQLLKTFQLALNATEKRLMQVYEPKIIALKTASLFLSNKIDQAVDRLEEFLSAKSGQISVKDDLNMHLTLVVLLNCQGNYKKANKYFLNFHHSDTWCTKKMGAEWVLRKNIIHAMVLFDCGRDDLASNLIDHISKNSSHMLKSRHYKNVQPFLALLSSFLRNPNSENKFELKQIEDRLVHAKNEQNLKRLSYLAWLKSRILGLDFYSEVLAIVGSKKRGSSN